MLATHYYALLTLAGALTAAWMFRPRQRTQVTTLAALVSWGLAAVLGGSVEVFDGANQTVVGNVSNGTAVAVGPPDGTPRGGRTQGAHRPQRGLSERAAESGPRARRPKRRV